MLDISLVLFFGENFAILSTLPIPLLELPVYPLRHHDFCAHYRTNTTNQIGVPRGRHIWYSRYDQQGCESILRAHRYGPSFVLADVCCGKGESFYTSTRV